MAESCLFFVGNFPTTKNYIFYQKLKEKKIEKKKEKEIFFAEKKTLLTSTCVLLLYKLLCVASTHHHHGENYRPENRTSFTAAATEEATVSL